MKPYVDLPLTADPSSRFLPWIVAFMVYLATLALMVAVSVSLLIHQWNRGVSDHLTIEIPASNLFSATAQEDQEALKQQIVQLLSTAPGLGIVKLLSAEEILGNLKTASEIKTSLDTSFFPQLIDVEVKSRDALEVERLKEKLQALSPGIILEDHLNWQQGILDLARTIQIISFFVISMIILAAIGTIAFTSQTSLIIHRQVIEILYLVGATDDYIGKQFQYHAFRIGIKGGFIGFLLSASTFLGLKFIAKNLDIQLLNDVISTVVLWALALVVPLLVTVFMMIAAKATVRLALRYTI